MKPTLRSKLASKIIIALFRLIVLLGYKTYLNVTNFDYYGQSVARWNCTEEKFYPSEPKTSTSFFCKLFETVKSLLWKLPWAYVFFGCYTLNCSKNLTYIKNPLEGIHFKEKMNLNYKIHKHFINFSIFFIFITQNSLFSSSLSRSVPDFEFVLEWNFYIGHCQQFYKLRSIYWNIRNIQSWLT